MTLPWHLWLVSMLYFLLYCGGIYDYFMILLNPAEYFYQQNYNAGQIAYFTDYSFWLRILWTLNLFAAVISVLLLLRRRRSAVAFALIAFLSMLALDIVTFAFRDRWQLLGEFLTAFDLGILLMTGAFYCYVHRICQRWQSV
jgi:uncharacterized membrane protein YfhO